MGAIHPSSGLTTSDLISPIVFAFSISEWKPWNIHEGFCVCCRGWYWPVHHHKGHLSDQLDHHGDPGEEGRGGARWGRGPAEKGRGSRCCHGPTARGKGTSPRLPPGACSDFGELPSNAENTNREWVKTQANSYFSLRHILIIKFKWFPLSTCFLWKISFSTFWAFLF